MQSTFENRSEMRVIRCWLIFFMAALFISGATAIPLEAELKILRRLFPGGDAGHWFTRVHEALIHNRVHYPFMNYGYDWLAFAHFVLAILFVGPYRDPVRNKWVIEFGMIACVLIIPFAFVAGYFRGISTEWRLIDCSFGVIGLIPLVIVRKLIKKMETGQITEEGCTRSANMVVP
ncbi:MAG: hypothetical protein ABWZ25_14650 [Chitinophagaceae bacterium]